MNATVLNAAHLPSAFSSKTAHVDEGAVKPLPNSRKVYVNGSRPDIRVPMREISQSDTPPAWVRKKIRRFMFTTLPDLTPIRQQK